MWFTFYFESELLFIYVMKAFDRLKIKSISESWLVVCLFVCFHRSFHHQERNDVMDQNWPLNKTQIKKDIKKNSSFCFLCLIWNIIKFELLKNYLTRKKKKSFGPEKSWTSGNVHHRVTEPDTASNISHQS